MFLRRRASKEAVVDSAGSASDSVGSGLLNLSEKALDKRVTKAQTKAEKLNRQSVKLLILGSGGSGKTTLRKQFSRLYANAFKDAKVRVDLKDLILYNLLEGMKATLVAAEHLGGGLKSKEAIDAARVINAVAEDPVKLTDAVAEAFKVLHEDPVIKETLEVHRSKFQLQECFLPYFDEVLTYPSWGGPIWIPSEDDCVRSRIRSSGIIEVDFEYEKTKFRIFDAGGQRAERRKWIHAFDDVTALIFVASLTEYDEVLFEDKTKNRLQETLEVWEDLVNSANFINVPILLFLNKIDLFEDKYVRRRIPMNVTNLFPDAPAGEPSVPTAIEWYKEQFKKRRTKSDPALLYIHVMAAVDANQVDTVFRDVKEIVLIRSMSVQGLV